MVQLIYFELNIDSIIQKYCVNKDKPEFQCNGKCHLANQLSETSNNNDDSNKSSRIIFESFIPVFLSKQQDLNFKNLLDFNKKKEMFGYVNAYFFFHTPVVYKPPIA